jgi:DNA-binding transcriptional regulator GbsR (MarR family)
VTIARSEAQSRQVAAWIERVAAAFAQDFGLPPITGRILGWLLVCEPAEQSPSEIAEAIGASRASLTTNMRLLTAGGLVRRRTRPGGRTTYFSIDDDAWEKLIRRRIATMAALSEITHDAMVLLGADSERAARVRAAHAFFGWLAERFAEGRPGALPLDPAKGREAL